MPDFTMSPQTSVAEAVREERSQLDRIEAKIDALRELLSVMPQDHTDKLQARIDELEKRNKELEEQLKGNIPQVSSGPLHNYPQASYQTEEAEDEPKPKQPLSGAAATAKEH